MPSERVEVVRRQFAALRGRASGVVTQGRYHVACTFRDGLIVSGREYATPAEAIAAVNR